MLSSMKLRRSIQRPVLFLSILFSIIVFAQEKSDSSKSIPSSKPAAPQKQQNGAKYYRAALILTKNAETLSIPTSDTLKIVARLIEIPGKFPSNDLYNYVFIMKYRVNKILKGSYTKKEILIGHYNPLFSRDRIKDKMAEMVHGNVKRFEVNATHMLTLIRPIDRIWKDAVEDDYTDSDLESYFAIEADTLAK
jgi:hypothetical protein